MADQTPSADDFFGTKTATAAAPAKDVPHADDFFKSSSATQAPADTQQPQGATGVKGFAEGLGEGALQTLTSLSPLIHKIPYVGETLVPESGMKAAEKMATPTTPSQKIGNAVEQGAEFLIPGPGEEALATKFPGAAKAIRAGYGAIKGGGIAAAHESGETGEVTPQTVGVGAGMGVAGSLASPYLAKIPGVGRIMSMGGPDYSGEAGAKVLSPSEASAMPVRNIPESNVIHPAPVIEPINNPVHTPSVVPTESTGVTPPIVKPMSKAAMGKNIVSAMEEATGTPPDPIKVKYPNDAVRQMVRANGERIVDAIGEDKSTMKAVHDLSRVDLRQALINSGEDMGQTVVSDSKYAGEGSIGRQAAFEKLLDKGLAPKDIVALAKKPLAQ